MSKNQHQILVFVPNILNQNHWQVYELDLFQKDYKIEVCEMGKIMNYEFFKKTEHKRFNNNTVAFENLYEVISYLYSKKSDNIVIFNMVPFEIKIKRAMIFFLILLRRAKIFHFRNTVLPTNFDRNKNKIYITIRNLVYNILGYSLKLLPSENYIVYTEKGEQETPQLREFYFKYCSKIVSVTPDISVIKSKKLYQKEKNLKDPYCVYLDFPAPKFAGDRLLFSEEYFLTCENWYPKLCKLFVAIETTLNLEVVIAAHPKSSWNPENTEFSDRKIYENRTNELLLNAEFVIGVASTVMLTAHTLNVPILYVTSEESRKMKTHYENILIFNSHYPGIIVDLSQEMKEISKTVGMIPKRENQKINFDKMESNYEVIENLIRN